MNLTEPDLSRLATKADIADLKTAIADLKADLTRVVLTTLIAMTAIFSGISAALRFIR